MRLALLCSVAVGAASACSYPRPTPLPEPERFVIQAPLDSVFRASLQTLVKWKFVITFADKSSGVIATAPRVVPTDDTLSTVLYRSTNCGIRPTGPLGVIDTYRVQASVALEDMGDSTALRISLGTNASWFDLAESDPDDRLPTTPCQSAGPFERALAGEIRARAREAAADPLGARE